MKRIHEMPFGAALADGATRFRLWAPSAQRVELRLGCDDTAPALPMQAREDGWFELPAEGVAAGSRYRFRIDGGLEVPDPASRCNPDDVHGASEVIDPAAFEWQDDGWMGRPWHEAVIYELHVGAFSPQGGFNGVAERLDYLAEVGVTAIELMPVADFAGRRNWGYDGVLPFAPDSRYGRPEDMKALVQAAHARGLMVFLDVVYNHFGPEGNYLGSYAAPFFTARHKTPWGDALAFDGPQGDTVRSFFIHNALYWIEEFHLDGLRFDAVHAIPDEGRQRLLVDLAEAARSGPARQRHVHLVLENDANEARYLRHAPDAARLYEAQWDDDLHHALHVLLTGERDGYYDDYRAEPLEDLRRCLAAGFAWQGQPSGYRGGAVRGESTAGLTPEAFVAFLQNHDQIGNRAFGERIGMLAEPHAVDAAQALLLLAPFPPLLFMGEEFRAASPFLFFCDFAGELAQAVTRGRREEFARFAGFGDAAARERIPDPNHEETFRRSCLDWGQLALAPHGDCLWRTRQLLGLRHREITPRLAGMRAGTARCKRLGARTLAASWTLGDGTRLALVANLGGTAVEGLSRPAGRLLHATPPSAAGALEDGALPAWSVVWLLDETDALP
ncbi:MAG TPA: malto-oligosyltrehalose trehalohydrolase [Rhodocyclaceae bacterium]